MRHSLDSVLCWCLQLPGEQGYRIRSWAAPCFQLLLWGSKIQLRISHTRFWRVGPWYDWIYLRADIGLDFTCTSIPRSFPIQEFLPMIHLLGDKFLPLSSFSRSLPSFLFLPFLCAFVFPLVILWSLDWDCSSTPRGSTDRPTDCTSGVRP